MLYVVWEFALVAFSLVVDWTHVLDNTVSRMCRMRMPRRLPIAMFKSPTSAGCVQRLDYKFFGACRLSRLEDDLEELIHHLEPPGSSDQAAGFHLITSKDDASQVKALARVGPQYNIVSAELDHLRKQVGVLEEEAAARERALSQAGEERRLLQAQLQNLKQQVLLDVGCRLQESCVQ